MRVGGRDGSANCGAPVGAICPIGWKGTKRCLESALRGEKLTLQGNGDALMISGMMIGPTEGSFIATGTRVMSIERLLPDTK